MTLPYEITLNGKVNRLEIPAEGIVVSSDVAPQIDAKGFYLKKVVYQ